MAPRGKAIQTSRDSRKRNKANQPPLFTIEMIAKLDRTQINAKTKKIGQLQNPTMGATINNESQTTATPP